MEFVLCRKLPEMYFEENKYDNFDYDNIVENSKWKKDTE